MPELVWSKIWASYYAEMTVGVNRYYIAMGHNDRVDQLIRVQRNREISPATDRAKIGGEWYRITQVQHVTDEDGLPMTDLSLERLEGFKNAGDNQDNTGGTI